MYKLLTDKSAFFFYLILAFLLGALPALSYFHVFAKDFIGYWVLAESFRQFGEYTFTEVRAYGSGEVGLQARAPFFPLLISISTFIFGKNLLGALFPIVIARLLVLPLTYILAHFFLPIELAFLASSLLIFIPKLQTYSLSAFEADVFVAVLFLLILIVYIEMKKRAEFFYKIALGVILGLLTLVKELGLPISLGLLTYYLINFLKISKPLETLKEAWHVLLSFFLIAAPFFIYTIYKENNLYFSGVTADRSLSHVIGNLQVLILTFPNYLGFELTTTFKSIIIMIALLSFLIVGWIYFFKKAAFLTFPIIFTIFALSLLNTEAIGGKTVGNFELVTIFAFAMPVLTISLIKGAEVTTGYLANFLGSLRVKKYIIFLLALIITYKFYSNHFAKPYTLDFAGDYYINIFTVVFNKTKFPEYSFTRREDGTLLTDDLSPLLVFMKTQYVNERVIVFTQNYKSILSIIMIIAFAYFALRLFTNNFKVFESRK